LETVKFIRELLYEHECVIIPGFGALIGNYVPAHFDRVKSVFQPPSKQIGFNKRLNHNDGLLAGTISREKQIGYVDAKRIVDEFVTEINKKIQKGEVLVFEGVGRFVSDKSKKISFEQDPSENFFLDSFGLVSFNIQERDSRPSIRRTEKRLKNIGIQQKSVKKRKYALVAYIGIPVLAAALALSVLYSDSVRDFKLEISSLNPFSAKVESEIVTPHPVLTDKTEESVAGEIETSIREMTSKKAALLYEEAVTVEKEVAEEIPVSEDFLVHYLIAGSFKNYDNAINLKKDLESDGFSAEILDFGNDFYRVSMASFSNRDKALNELYKVRADKGLSSVWLLSK
jgi:nucleoid DNA-binding protein